MTTMTTSRFERLLPLAGALGGLVAIVAMVLTINEPSITDGEQKYVRWYSDHQAVETIAGFAAIYFCVLMLFFATAVRRALRSGERGSSAHANAAFYLATGLGALRTGALPKWLAIVTIVLGVLSLTGPTGIAVFFATPVWLIVTSALLYRRQTTLVTAPRSSAKHDQRAVGAL